MNETDGLVFVGDDDAALRPSRNMRASLSISFLPAVLTSKYLSSAL
jgi:hypothetical protein